MKKRVLLPPAIVVGAVAGLILWGASLWRERSYNGKPESYWIGSLVTPPSPLTRDTMLAWANEWEALGPQAVPILLKTLEMQPGPLARPYVSLWHQLPTTLQKLAPRPMDYPRLHANAWSRLATQRAKVILSPRLVVRALKDNDWIVRMKALSCLNAVVLPNSGAEKDELLPMLLAAAEDPQMEVRVVAVLCLGQYRDQFELVFPVLTNALVNPYPDVRIRAAMALHQINPAAAKKARVADVAYDCLNSDSGILAKQFLESLEKPTANEP